MAKKSNSSKRGVSNTANPRLHLTFSPFNPHPLQLNLFEDRREFHPDSIPAPRLLDSSKYRLKIPNSKYRLRLPHAVAFEQPLKVLICVRRKIRKEVLFARRLTGRGAAKKFHRHGPYSSISCK